MLVLLFIGGVSLTHLLLALFLSGEFLLHVPCWLHFYMGSFSYTSRASFIFMRGVSLTQPVLASFLSGEFLLHIPCWFDFSSPEFLLHISCWLHFCQGSFSYTSRATFIFIWGVSLTHPVLAFFCVGSFSGMQSSLKTTPEEMSWVEDGPGKNLKRKEKKKSEKFTLKSEKEPYNTLYRAEQNQTKTGAGFFMWKFVLTCPMLACSCWEFMLHLLCWLLDVGSFSYTSSAGFFA